MSNPFDKPTSTPTLTFSTKDEYGRTIPKAIGTRLGGIALKGPEVVQSRFYEGPDKGKPQFWDSDGKGKKVIEATTKDGRSNNPVLQIVLPVQQDDGEVGSFWISYYPKAQYEALQQVLTLPDGSVRAIEPGDKVYMTLIGLKPEPGKNPSYVYGAEFTKGAGAFAPAAGIPASAPPPPPATAVAAPTPPPPSVVTEPVLSNGFTASALRAARWTEDQVAALSAPAPVVAPAPAPAAPAAPAPPAEAPAVAAASVDEAAAARQAKLDAMPEADRRLLGL